ncbi:unnamed protein product [Didymodactylos carnosus]|uniref:Uncharacterized protein n=1 Tax=Didymodactylos carnosus TaxID=1234261 RepID=A0A8S2VSE2_9BILA|nr:unnamed protein product [Didymodactylos carnosus]
MRLLLGFFARLPNIDFFERTEVFDIVIPKRWSWFYLRPKQLLLFVQDPVHLATKWRNRLLSATAQLTMGNQKISVQDLVDIVKKADSKIEHSLVLSDLIPADRQNFRSCQKISSECVLKILQENKNTSATFVYLKLLKYIIDAYISNSTSITDRLFLAWSVVFVCRIWKTWLKCKSFDRKSKEILFITTPAYYSVELNAHSLLYLVLLVKTNILPIESLQIPLFSSQSCEGMFRNARSLTGTQSTMINFSVYDFLHRTEKITALNYIKTTQIENKDFKISFPRHHKHGKKEDSSRTTLNMDDIDDIDIDEIISKAFAHAKQLMSGLEIDIVLQKNKLLTLERLSQDVFNSL